MKHLIIASAMFLTSAVAAAKPMATLNESGGFCPGQCPSTNVTIEDNGNVVINYQTQFPTPNVERIVLARLSSEVITAMRNEIAGLSTGDLIDQNADAPYCADIPSYTYTVVKGEQKIDIGVDRDCHELRLANFAGNEIVATLKSFKSLYAYSKRR